MLKLGLMREPVFPGGSPLPRVHIFPSKSDREPADTRLSCVNRKKIKCLAGKVEKKILVLTIPWWAPSSLHRLRLRAGLPTSRLTSHAKLFPAPYHRLRFLFPFFFLLQPSQMFNGYAIVSCILLFWYSPLHMSLFNYVHKLWFNYSLCIFVLAYICYVLNFSYTL